MNQRRSNLIARAKEARIAAANAPAPAVSTTSTPAPISKPANSMNPPVGKMSRTFRTRSQSRSKPYPKNNGNQQTNSHQQSTPYQGNHQRNPPQHTIAQVIHHAKNQRNQSTSVSSPPLPVIKAPTRGRFHKLFCTLRQTFEKLFKGIERALRRAPNFNRASLWFPPCAQLLWNRPLNYWQSRWSPWWSLNSNIFHISLWLHSTRCISRCKTEMNNRRVFLERVSENDSSKKRLVTKLIFFKLRPTTVIKH